MATYVTIAKRPVIVFTIRAGRSSARDIMSLYRMSKSPWAYRVRAILCQRSCPSLNYSG